MKIKLLIISALLLGTSCKKDLVEQYELTKPKTSTTKTSDLKVSKDFDWKTTKEINLNLIGYANSPVTILDADGTIVQKAFLKTDQEYLAILSVPAYQNNVKLLYMGQEVTLELNQKNITYKFN
jgi:hypothetical protein